MFIKRKEEELEKVQTKHQMESANLETKIKDLSQKLRELEINFEKAEQNKSVNHQSVNDSDDMSLIMIENENLKRKIKLLEQDSVKQNQLDKLAKKIAERDEELKMAKQKHSECESLLVFLKELSPKRTAGNEN